jgi:carotenoid cleavage dioxygenase-like enzyme
LVDEESLVDWLLRADVNTGRMEVFASSPPIFGDDMNYVERVSSSREES